MTPLLVLAEIGAGYDPLLAPTHPCQSVSA
jgi:hypothetical protein